MPTQVALAELLRILVENKGSDLHLQSGEVPMGRFDGQLGRFEMAALADEDLLRLAREVLGSDGKFNDFVASKDCGAGVAISGLVELEFIRRRRSRIGDDVADDV